MKDIFRPEDFFYSNKLDQRTRAYFNESERILISKMSKARFRSWLEENGKKVYTECNDPEDIQQKAWVNIPSEADNYRAYLIGIEKRCKHPKEKLRTWEFEGPKSYMIKYFNCDCGARVEPTGFRAIGESEPSVGPSKEVK